MVPKSAHARRLPLVLLANSGFNGSEISMSPVVSDIAQLIALVGDNATDTEKAYQALSSFDFSTISEKMAIEFTERLLNQKNQQLRQLGLRQLRTTTSDEIADRLLAVFHSEAETRPIRSTALSSFVRVRGAKAIPVLLKIAFTSQVFFQEIAVSQIARIVSEDSIGALRNIATHHPDSALVLSAHLALAQNGSLQSVEQLSKVYDGCHVINRIRVLLATWTYASRFDDGSLRASVLARFRQLQLDQERFLDGERELLNFVAKTIQ
jgi:hypothetical protein